jgi:Ni/Co efflux regulator RcnB
MLALMRPLETINTMKILSLILFACVLMSAPAFAGNKHAVGAATNKAAGGQFSSGERRLIIDYFDAHGAAAGAKSLPPGIAKKLARGGTLPPGIAKRRLPDALVVRLPPVPRGYERIVVDGRVLLVEIATRVIHDVLTEIIVR